jgi:nucleoside-diphosphate kinase
MADATERSFIMIKPDGVQRGLVGDILRRFEQRGYKLVALKMIQVSFKKIFYLKKTFFLFE